RGHAPVHRVETVRIAEEIGRRLRRAANPGDFRHPVRLDRQFVASLDDRGGDRVVPAAGAQRRYRALVVAVGVAELVLRQVGMAEFRLGEIGHGWNPESRTRCSALAVHRRSGTVDCEKTPGLQRTTKACCAAPGERKAVKSLTTLPSLASP